ncbi:MAG TPA: hypothetical protein VFZ66_16035 [Herpetosiphonaceae bacterium]
MDPLIMVAVAVLVLAIVAALVIFRPGGDFKPNAANDVVAPLKDDGPVMMKYQGGASHDDSDEPLQDVLQMRDDDAAPPMPSRAQRRPDDLKTGLLADRPKPPAPSPEHGPIIRSFNPNAVLGGDGAAVPAPGDGQKDILNFTRPPQNPGPQRDE